MKGAVVSLSMQHGCKLGVLRMHHNSTSRGHFLGAVARGLTSPSAIVRTRSILCVANRIRGISQFTRSCLLRVLSKRAARRTTGTSGSLSFCSVNVTRVMLVPSSGLSGHAIGRTNFHSGFGLGILNVHHGGRCVLRRLNGRGVRDKSMLLIRNA